jgi:hypothetical protein
MQPDRTAELKDRLEQHILVLDGAMGTMIQRHGLQEAITAAAASPAHAHDLKGNNDLLLLTRPDSSGDPCRVSGGRRGHHRNQHLQLDQGFAGRLPPRSHRP